MRHVVSSLSHGRNATCFVVASVSVPTVSFLIVLSSLQACPEGVSGPRPHGPVACAALRLCPCLTSDKPVYGTPTVGVLSISPSPASHAYAGHAKFAPSAVPRYLSTLENRR